MALRWLFLLVACCGVSKASDDEVVVCRDYCLTITTVLIPDLYDNSTETAEESEHERGDITTVSPQTVGSRGLLDLDIHTFCTFLCQRMEADEVMMELYDPHQENNDVSQGNENEETEQENRFQRRKVARARKMTTGARKMAAVRRGTHSKQGKAARQRQTH